ncbi:type VI secretion system baseplate subunit TssE [Gemmata sp.]|uniref:type VI secretion system baseplate subunit TssE n=1 Tax=Gemmata sp. TaxID=1914242 RepID=UPI003F6EB349
MPPAPGPPIRNLLPSVLDRLLAADTGPALSATGVPLSLVLEAVRRDVEALLNTRQNTDPDLALFPELARSVYSFGMPELVSRRAISGPDREAIGRLMADAIARHEPRIRGVRAVVVPPEHPAERRLKFKIEGTLRIDPGPTIEFETVLELGSGQTAVVARET